MNVLFVYIRSLPSSRITSAKQASAPISPQSPSPPLKRYLNLILSKPIKSNNITFIQYQLMSNFTSKNLPPNYILTQTPCPVLKFQPAMSTHFTTPPPPVQDSLITFPYPNILLVTLNRPKELNSINLLGHEQLAALWTWYDTQPSRKFKFPCSFNSQYNSLYVKST